MAGLSSDIRLQHSIMLLKEKEKKLAEEFSVTIEKLSQSVSPAGIISSAINDITGKPGIKGTVIDIAAGIGAGWLGRKLFTGNSKNIFSKATGSVLQFLLSGLVSRRMRQVRKKASAG